jgi:ectoine hydroxylase-related dioxygenase (phytanoyl-CoA dioxygenase family)
MGVMRQLHPVDSVEPPHVAAYRRDGFAVVRGVFGPGDLAALAEAFDRQQTEGLRLGASWRHGNRCYRLSDDPATGLGVAMVQWPSYADPVLARYRNDPRLLAIVAPLIGNDLKQIINQCHWKAPGAVAADYNFHQDIRFRRPREAFRHLDASYIQTGIAIDAHTSRNGAMRVAPGSHLLGEIASLGEGVVLGKGRGDTVLREAGIDPAKLVDLTLEPGDVAFWHPCTVHGSGPNHGTDQRRFYLNSYVRAPDCDRGEWAFRAGKPVALSGDPVLVHYEALYTRPEPHYLDSIPPAD